MKQFKVTFLICSLFLSMSLDTYAQIKEINKKEAEEKVILRNEAPPPPPPPPPPPQPEVQEIFKVVEEMPRFPGCEDLRDKNERLKCSQEKMLKYVYDNMNYPEVAKKNQVEGTVVIQFVVEKTGNIKGAKIVRDIGAGCGAEALRIINLMPKWNPGKQRGRPVRVQYNFPVKFKIPANKN